MQAKTMRALQQCTHAGPSDMRLVTDVPIPTPGPREVLIRVNAAGVNYADLSRSRGTFFGGPTPPFIAGFEAAGEVVAVGDGVTVPAVGARVVGVGDGAFAQFAVLHAAGAVPVPPGWTPTQALGLVVNWPTAIAALRTLGGLRPGEVVLIHAAAGATGQCAVALARHYGARVLAAASPSKHDLLRSLGVEEVLDGSDDALASDVLERTETY